MKTVLLIQSVCDVVYVCNICCSIFIDLLVKNTTILTATHQ